MPSHRAHRSQGRSRCNLVDSESTLMAQSTDCSAISDLEMPLLSDCRTQSTHVEAKAVCL